MLMSLESVARVYNNINLIPDRLPCTIRMLTGGIFDGINSLHPGHIASLQALANPFNHEELFDLKAGDGLGSLDRNYPIELLVGIPTDLALLGLNRVKRPIMPQKIRVDRLRKIPGVSAVFLNLTPLSRPIFN